MRFECDEAKNQRNLAKHCISFETAKLVFEDPHALSIQDRAVDDGQAIFLSSAVAFLLPPAFLIYLNRFQIEPEERALASLFGREFVAYKSRVRRWL